MAKNKATNPKDNKKGVFKFFKETIVELKKVVWPTKKQLVVNTTIVIVASIFLSLFIYGFDSIFLVLDKIIFIK